MVDFGYTPEIGQVTGYTAQIGVKSKVAGLAGDISSLLMAKKVSDVRVAKAEAKYLDDEAKERMNDAQLNIMELQDKLYEDYNTTADPEARNRFVQEFEDNATKVGGYYNIEGDDLVTLTKGYKGTTNKLRLYNSNVVGKVNDTVNVSKANTADFATMDVANTKEMDSTILSNNKDYLIKTEFGGNKAKYFDAKFTDYGVRLKESVAETSSPEEIDILLNNLDIFAKEKLGDIVSVNNKDVTVDSTMYNGYHKNRQFLLEKRATAITKLKATLPQHIKGRNKDAYMATIERVAKVGGFENPDLKQSAIDSWDLKTEKANTSKINAMKKQPDYVAGYVDPSLVETTYKAHGGTDEQFIIDYKTKHDFTQNYLTNPINTDLSANPKQAKIVADDVIKKLVLSGDVATAVDMAGKTGQGGVINSFTTSALSEEDPKILTQNVNKVLEGYYTNQSVMSNNMEKDDKSAMFFYAYQMRRGGELTEGHIDRVKQGNAEGIIQKAGKEFNEEFAGKSNYTENIGIYSALIKYGVPPQTAVDYIKEDTEAHIVSVSSGLFTSMDVDMRGAPNGVQTYDTEQLEEVLAPLVDKVDKIGIEGDKKLVYDKSTGDFRLFVDEVPMQDMAVNLDDLIKYKQKADLAVEKGAWATTTRKVEAIWDSFMTGTSEAIRDVFTEIDRLEHEYKKQQSYEGVIRLTTNKALKAETKNKALAEEAEAKKAIESDPAYVESTMEVALNSRENATALFNKDGINDYINFLNSNFSTILTQPLIVSEDGRAIVDKTKSVDVTNPNGREKLKTIIKDKQAINNTVTKVIEEAPIASKPILSNLVNNMEAIRVAEVGDKIFKEGQLHVGQETITPANPKGTKNTTRYGVVITNFPKIGKETDYDHAVRYYTKNVLPAIENVKGIETASENTITALSKLVWNKGNIIKKLDLNDQAGTISTLLDVTTTSGKHSNGVINRTIQDYGQLATELGYPQVAFVETTPPKSGKYRIQYFDKEGKLIHDDARTATTAPGSTIGANKRYIVRNNSIDIRSGIDK